MKKIIVIFSILLIPLVLMASGIDRSKTAPAPPPEQDAQNRDYFTPGKGVERAYIKASETMSRDEILSELKVLYGKLNEEEQWASFIEATRLHLRDNHRESFDRWKQTWSLATSGLWVNSNMLAARLRSLDSKEVSTSSLQTDWALLKSMLPLIQEARHEIVRGILSDVYGIEDGGLFLDAWEDSKSFEEQKSNP